MPSLSIIIPTRRLGPHIDQCVAGYRACLPGAEVIVVEAVAEERIDDEFGRVQPVAAGVSLVSAKAGRGPQCNAGAGLASGEVLLFLHDDCVLPEYAGASIAAAFADDKILLASFRLRFDDPHWLLAVYAWFSRFDSLLTSFGDQGILVRRQFFEALGGFPDWPLFEDVELLRRARRHTRVRKLRDAITTSAVRFRRNGILRQQLLNASLILRFLLGTPPSRLVESYDKSRRRPRGRTAQRPAEGQGESP